MASGTYDIRSVADDCGDLLALRRLWHPGDDASYEERFRAWWERERAHRHAVLAYDAGGAPTDLAKAGGMVRVVLAPSEMSTPMYRSLGFRPDDDLMRLDLAP